MHLPKTGGGAVEAPYAACRGTAGMSNALVSVRLDGRSCRAESNPKRSNETYRSTRNRTSAKKAGSRLMQYDCSLHALSLKR
jgi:hypothetical protein